MKRTIALSKLNGRSVKSCRYQRQCDEAVDLTLNDSVRFGYFENSKMRVVALACLTVAAVFGNAEAKNDVAVEWLFLADSRYAIPASSYYVNAPDLCGCFLLHYGIYLSFPLWGLLPHP